MKTKKYWMVVTLIFMVVTFLSANLLAFDMAEYQPLGEGDTWINLVTLTVTGNVEEAGTFGPYVSKAVVTGAEMVNSIETMHVEYGPVFSTIPSYNCVVMDAEGSKLYKEFLPALGVYKIYDIPCVYWPAQFDLGESHEGVFSKTIYNVADDTLNSIATGNNSAVLESVEDVTVPAGTFSDCLKIYSSFTEQTDSGWTISGDTTSLLCQNVGSIKSSSTTYFRHPEEEDFTTVQTIELLRAKVGREQYGACPAEMLLASNDEKLAVIRQFRDEILANYAAGEKLINAYYINEERIMDVLYTHPLTREMAKNVLETLVPTMKLLIELSK